MRVTTGCMTRPWSGYTLDRALEGIARAGYKYTAYVGQHEGQASYTLQSTDAEVEALRKRVEGFGLQAVAAWAGDPLNYGSEGMRRHVELAGVLGLKFLILSSPYSTKRQRPDLTVDEEFATIVEPVLDLAESLGVGLHVKPHMGEFGTGPGLAALARRIDHPLFGVSYDPGNIHYYEGLRADEDVQDAAPYVRSMCVKDHRGAQRENDFPTPGEGDVNWPPIWQALAGANFEGFALVEVLGPKDGAEAIDQAAETVRRRLVEWVEAAGGTVQA